MKKTFLVPLLGVFLLSGCTALENPMSSSPSESPTSSSSQSPTPEALTEGEKKLYEIIPEEEFHKAVEKGIEAYIKTQQEKERAQQEEQQKQQEEFVKNVPDAKPGEHFFGKEDAEFILYEYSDYHCPFCKKFYPTSKEFISKAGGNVAVVFRPLPLDGLHPQSRGVHEIAECVAEVGGNKAFWQFSDEVFGATKENITDKNYEPVLKKIGVNAASVKTCYESGKYKEKVEAFVQEANALGIRGTPGSILKNTKTGEVQFFNGAYELSALQSGLQNLQ